MERLFKRIVDCNTNYNNCNIDIAILLGSNGFCLINSGLADNLLHCYPISRQSLSPRGRKRLAGDCSVSLYRKSLRNEVQSSIVVEELLLAKHHVLVGVNQALALLSKV
jgi:hypothetical protein